MSSEPAADRQGTSPVTGNLVVGAIALALFVYEDDSPNAVRNIYRNVLRLPLFRHGAQIAGLKTQITETLIHRGNEARDRIAAETAEAAKAKLAAKPKTKPTTPKRSRRPIQQISAN